MEREEITTDKGLRIILRSLCKGDLPALVSLEKETFSSCWELNLIETTLESSLCCNIGACVETGELIGFIFCTYCLDEAELLRIGVNSRYGRCGVGRALMQALHNELECLGVRKVFLEVRNDNNIAICLYRGMGFFDFSVRKEYYGRGIDAMIMKLDIV